MLNWAQSARHKILCKDLAVSSSQFFCMYVTSIPTTCMPYVAAAGWSLVVAPGGGAPLFDMKKTSRPASIYRAGPSINDVISREAFFYPFTSLVFFFSTWVLNLIICPSKEWLIVYHLYSLFDNYMPDAKYLNHPNVQEKKINFRWQYVDTFVRIVMFLWLGPAALVFPSPS